MIQLQVDFSLLNKYFGIPISRITQYVNKDIEEIMEQEAAQGNQKAADYQKILSDPDKILDIFKLADRENKYIIFQNMSEGDLDKLLPFLTQDQLGIGLRFFTEEKLIAMCKELPPEELIGMVLEKFNMVDILSYMEEDSMNQFLMDPKVERKYAQEYIQSLDGKTLEKIMIKSYGFDFKGKTKSESIEYLNGLADDDFKKFLVSFEREDKINLINGLTEIEPELMLLFEADDVVRPMEMLLREDKIKMMTTLDPEFLVPMVQELPLDLTQIVLTQIDPQQLAEVLAEDFQDILSSVVLFSQSMT